MIKYIFLLFLFISCNGAIAQVKYYKSIKQVEKEEVNDTLIFTFRKEGLKNFMKYDYYPKLVFSSSNEDEKSYIFENLEGDVKILDNLYESRDAKLLVSNSEIRKKLLGYEGDLSYKIDIYRYQTPLVKRFYKRILFPKPYYYGGYHKVNVSFHLLNELILYKIKDNNNDYIYLDKEIVFHNIPIYSAKYSFYPIRNNKLLISFLFTNAEISISTSKKINIGAINLDLFSISYFPVSRLGLGVDLSYDLRWGNGKEYMQINSNLIYNKFAFDYPKFGLQGNLYYLLSDKISLSYSYKMNIGYQSIKNEDNIVEIEVLKNSRSLISHQHGLSISMYIFD